jgi:hypothetical protein
VLAYLAVVALPSGAVEAAVIATHRLGLVAVLMATPALACVLVRLVRREGSADVSFRFGGRRTWLALRLTFLLPSGVGLVAYVPAWRPSPRRRAAPAPAQGCGSSP